MSNDEILHLATDRVALRTDALPFLDAELKKRCLSEADVEEYRRHLAATPAGTLPGKEQFVASSINGFGTTIYGKRDFWPDGSYIATKWVILFWIPLVPLRSMRVKELGRGSRGPLGWSTQYLVYSNEPLNLKQVAFIYSYVFLLLGGFIEMRNPDANLKSVPALMFCVALALPWVLRRRALETVKKRELLRAAEKQP